MHIEPGLVDASKIALSYASGAASLALVMRSSLMAIHRKGLAAWALRSLLASLCVFAFFELLPHPPVGVSEVHLILGSTLLLVFGAAPAALGLALGLLVQSLFFAPQDLPQYGMNVTTLLLPLFATAALARRIIPAGVAYVDLRYAQVLKLSLAFQGGIVFWVAFWAVYGRGLGADNLTSVARFGAAYLGVVLLEPLIDLAVLAAAKRLRGLQGALAVEPRLHRAG